MEVNLNEEMFFGLVSNDLGNC